MPKTSELRGLTDAQLQGELATLRAESVMLRFKKFGGRLESPARLRTVRRHIARLLTLAAERTQRTSGNE